MDYELAIIGAGPAGFSACIYGGRAGIKTVAFDKLGGGGLALIAPTIENFPSFHSITGADLMEKMKRHAHEYAELRLLEEIQSIDKKGEIFHVKTSSGTDTAKALLLATGSEYRKLGIPGELEFVGKGVSYCATCDGQFFKGKTIAVIGGGNSALIEALYLQQIGVKEVKVIHRRDRLRAEKTYEDKAEQAGITIVYSTHVEEIKGTDHVERLYVHNTHTNEKSHIPVDGVFVSIGEEPNNALAKALGVKLDDRGYILVDRQQRTNIKGVYAAGDITGGLRQIITACAEGAIAALTSTEVLGKQYPY
jgi:thioredoxin reductase (NADPH)